MEEKKSRKRNPFLIIFFILIGSTLILCTTVLGLWLHGRSSMNQPISVPTLPSHDQQANTLSSNTIIEYQGKRYQYNESMHNILLMGIDSNKTAAEAAGDHDQSDVLVLAALNQDAGKMTLISISRDTMCDIQVLDWNGNPDYLMHTQLALSYAYGDGQHQSCQMTRDAVSNLFYGLPIHGYGSFYLEGISALNDAVGGVTVTILDDYPFTAIPGGSQMHAGLEKTLTGREARIYIQARPETGLDSNHLRMQRQKQYMLSLISRAKQLIQQNPVSILNIYTAVDDYILTDLDLGEISYLATLAAGMDFSGDLRSVQGNLVLSEDNFAELHVDETALYELMLDVFYTEIPHSLSDSPNP